MPCYTVSVTPTDRIFVVTPDDAIREFKGEHILHPHTQEVLVSINAASRNPKTGELEYKISTGNHPIFHLSKKNMEQDRFLRAWTMNEAIEEIRLAIYKDVCLTELSHLATVTSSTIRIQGVSDAMIADLITVALPEDAAYLREQRRILAGGAPADTLTVEGIPDIPHVLENSVLHQVYLLHQKLCGTPTDTGTESAPGLQSTRRGVDAQLEDLAARIRDITEVLNARQEAETDAAPDAVDTNTLYLQYGDQEIEVDANGFWINDRLYVGWGWYTDMSPIIKQRFNAYFGEKEAAPLLTLIDMLYLKVRPLFEV